jgi:ADP-heptose:LPS heptosyltransferase
MDNFYNLGTRLGIDKNTSLEIVKPVITKDDQKIVDDLMAENGLSRGCVAVHANVSDLSVERRWPYKNFEQLIERLLLHYPIQVVFIGAKSERESVREIISNIHCQGIADLVGKLTISQLAYFFENAKLVIANDSGPLHLAVAMGTPTVSFFGPETPLIYGPRGEHHTVFFKNTDCSPCMNVHNRKSVQCYWRTPACMEAITVDEVYAVVQAKLS